MTGLPLLAGFLGMAVVFIAIPLILHYSRRTLLAHRAADLHHTHKTAVPRLGGIALAAAFVIVNLVTVILMPEQRNLHDRLVVVGTSLAMFALGLWDDLQPLGAQRKLLGQILIASIVCCFGIGVMTFKVPFTGQLIDLGTWGVFITILWLVSMTNLINLIDGVDGLAGGMCLMLMALLAYVGHQNGNFELLASGMAGALLGFLWFNFPPARIYLGDGGAYFLGFQIGLLALIGSQKGTIAAVLVAPLFVLALPIVDMTLAILRRGLRGLPIFRPDRRHIHHRLLEMGFSRRKAVLSLYAITLVFLLMGFLVFVSEGQWVPALLGISALILLLCAGKLNFSREWFAVGRVLGNSLEMRQEIQYTLSLIRWLSLEGARQQTLEALWPDLVFIAQRLGFTFISLKLADGVRVWQDADASGPTQSRCLELRGGHSGVLELKAPMEASAQQTDSGKSYRRPIVDPKLFDILAELLAEGWLKATKSWERQKHLSFGSQRFTVDKIEQVPGPMAPVQVIAPASETKQ